MHHILKKILIGIGVIFLLALSGFCIWLGIWQVQQFVEYLQNEVF